MTETLRIEKITKSKEGPVTLSKQSSQRTGLNVRPRIVSSRWVKVPSWSYWTPNVCVCVPQDGLAAEVSQVPAAAGVVRSPHRGHGGDGGALRLNQAQAGRGNDRWHWEEVTSWRQRKERKKERKRMTLKITRARTNTHTKVVALCCEESKGLIRPATRWQQRQDGRTFEHLWLVSKINNKIMIFLFIFFNCR